MTDSNTSGSQGPGDNPTSEQPQTPQEPQAPQTPEQPQTPPAPSAPAWGAPAAPEQSQTPPPAAPPAPAYGAPAASSSGTYEPPTAPPSAYPSPSAGGFPPPPSDSGFPPPPSGGFPPPPPQGGFPPPPAGYGQASQGYQAPPDAGAAFGWGWARFKENWVALVVSHLLWGLAIAVIFGGGFAIIAAATGSAASTNSDAVMTASASFGLVGIILLSFLAILAIFVSQIALTNGYLAIADGRRASIGDFFKFRNVLQGVILSLLIAVASGLLSFTGVGGLIVSFFTVFAMFFVVDRGMGAIEAIKASVDLALKNAGVTAILILLILVASFIGSLLCLIGLLVAMPVSYLAATYLYRRLTGGHVAA